MNVRTVYWNREGAVEMIDQTLLPAELKIIKCRTVEEVAEAIKSLRVRGAPAIGVAAAYGIALCAHNFRGDDPEEMKRELIRCAEILRSTRPTAVNLFHAIDLTLREALSGETVEEIRRKALETAEFLANEDIRVNRLIGEIGQELLEDGDTVMTHCNAGRLATVDWGTALGVIRSAVEHGKEIRVIATETRPLNQGSRLTAWELLEDGIEVTLITDSMSGYVMRKGLVDKIIVGADRIVRDAVFNKIGTYSHAVIARHHGIPFYVAAPSSTFDLGKEEKDVIIEERAREELIFCGEKQIAPLEVDVLNPAFDATPLELITAIICEKGIISPVTEERMREVLSRED
ncbi:MAG: methylthioribose-phosphate isomerase [Archaeoglobi archaeon]|nr:methylthioribose-phosphate isomerase [Archaeoglobi archaeon]